MTQGHPITDRKEMRRFALGGRAYFSLKNTTTGNHVTYNVGRDEKGFVVRAFTGTQNTDAKHYSYLGSLDESGTYHYVGTQAALDALLVAAEEVGDEWLVGFCKNARRTLDQGGALSERQIKVFFVNAKKLKVVASPLLPDDMRAKGFAWFWRVLNDSTRAFPEGFQFYHEGRCAACGRLLTKPESIVTGWGPECADRLGIPMAQCPTTSAELAA